MTIITRSSILLGLGLLAASNFITAPASAAPGDRPFLRDQKKNDKNDHRGDRDNRPGINVRPGGVIRPDHDNGRPGRPGWNNRPGMGNNNGRPTLNRTTSLTGRVLNNTRGNDFELRVNNRTIRVMAVNGEPRGLSRGDTVQAYGNYAGGTFRATRVSILNQGRR